MTVVVPVRYPLSNRSKRTLERAIEIARERQNTLTVLHIDLYQSASDVSRTTLKRAVEREFGQLDMARYVVRGGLLVEETILEEIHREDPSMVVIGGRQAGRWRELMRKLVGQPDVAAYLREQLSCELLVVGED